MECPDIENLEFDEESRQAINRIRGMERVADSLAVALTAGQLATIFNSRNSLKISRNISSSDWELYAEAMRSVPDIAQAQIEKVAVDQQLRSADEEKWRQRDFWAAIYQGCQIDDE